MDEQRAVNEVADQFFEALNAMFVGDLEPMKRLWSHADDVVYMGPDRVMLVGWAAVLEDWEKQAALRLGGKIWSAERHLHLGSTLAVVYDVANGSNVDDQGNPLEISIRGCNVFRKEDGAWKLIAHHSDPLPYLPG